MVIEELNLRNFRNYQDFSVSFSPNLNFLVGDNGQGKTNILESLYFLTSLNSFRTTGYPNLIAYGKDFSVISSRLKKRQVRHEIRVLLSKKGKKVHFDEKPVKYSSEFLREFYSVLFSPDQISQLKEFPASRRKFFDRLLSLLSDEYLGKMRDFGKVQKNKNILLRSKKRAEVAVWNKLLSEIIPFLCSSRKDLVRRINEIQPEIFSELTGRKNKLRLCYSSDMDEQSPEEVLQKMESKLEKEIIAGHMLYGPQRDHFWMTLDDRVDKNFFSQGEYRVSVLSLVLSFNQIIPARLKFHPTILLDDVFSELDSTVCGKIIEFVVRSSNQVFITATEVPAKFSEQGIKLQIKNGGLI